MGRTLSGCRIQLDTDVYEAMMLRRLLTQTASPGTFQSRLIQRIDAAIEEVQRPRYGRRSA